MPRNDNVQGGMFDAVLEDKALESMMEQLLELEQPKNDYRTVKKSIREILEKQYPDKINVDGENGGWVRIGKHRFQATAKERKAGEVKIGAGINFALNIELV